MSCLIDSISDGEQAQVFRSKDRIAKKEHRCCECGRQILIGEKYRYESGVWGYGPDSHKTCLDCISVRDVFFCSWTFGAIWEDMHELVLDYDGGLPAKKINAVTTAARELIVDIVDAFIDAEKS